MNLERQGRQFNLTKKSSITYKNLLLLGLSFGGMVFFFQQLLIDLNINVFRFRVGEVNIIALIGLVISLYGTYASFQKAISSEEKEEESTQYGYVIRELDQLANDLGEFNRTFTSAITEVHKNSTYQGEKQGERIGELEQEAYANKLLLEHHEKAMFHNGAQQQLAILEDKLARLEAILSILSRENEYALRLAKLEKQE